MSVFKPELTYNSVSWYVSGCRTGLTRHKSPTHTPPVSDYTNFTPESSDQHSSLDRRDGDRCTDTTPRRGDMETKKQ